MIMKRFILFKGDKSDPLGGLFDYAGSFKTKAAASKNGLKYVKEDEQYNWAHVLDVETGKVWVMDFEYGEIPLELCPKVGITTLTGIKVCP